MRPFSTAFVGVAEIQCVFSGGVLVMAIVLARLTAAREERLLIRSAQLSDSQLRDSPLRERTGNGRAEQAILPAAQGGSLRGEPFGRLNERFPGVMEVS